MSKNSSRPLGRHFLHIPRRRRCRTASCARWIPIIDHRGPEFSKLARRCLDHGIKTIFRPPSADLISRATGTGAWEAALVKRSSPATALLMVRDRPVCVASGRRCDNARSRARVHQTDMAHRRRSEAIEQSCASDKTRDPRRSACCTRNAGPLPLADRRDPQSIGARPGPHPALFIVDTSLARSTDYPDDEWGVDVTVCGCPEGLMAAAACSSTR